MFGYVLITNGVTVIGQKLENNFYLFKNKG